VPFLIVCLIFFAAIPLLARESVGSGESLPLWEAGFLAGGGYAPDYPAAEQNHWRGIGAPYFVYRGSIFRADRDGARANLFNFHGMKLEFSAAGSFPARSKDNRARVGMPDLDWLAEIGPRLTFPLWKAWGYTPLKLHIPLRAVLSTDFTNLKHQGYTLTPKLSFRAHDMWKPGWIGLATLSANFGDRQLNAYFFDVEPAYIRPDRPAYDARAGYVGSDVFAGAVVPLNHHFRVFVGGQFTFNEGAANSESPLFKKSINTAFFLGMGWTFYESKKPAVPFD